MSLQVLNVGCSSGCPHGGDCGIGIEWCEDDFLRDFGLVPSSAEQAAELVAAERCDCCGESHVVWSFTAWSEWDGEEPIYLVDFDRERGAT